MCSACIGLINYIIQVYRIIIYARRMLTLTQFQIINSNLSEESIECENLHGLAEHS